jgi:hypothetical protein
MKSNMFIATLIMVSAPQITHGQTAYGSCSGRSQSYQEAYEQSQRVQDLVCMQEALKREMNSGPSYSCGQTAQYYQSAYERSQRTSDLVCMQEALKRELR